MSKIITRSVFYYNTTVVLSTSALDFNEGGSEINASLLVGTYSFTEYALEVARAMNEVGGQAYTVTPNRATRTVVISAPGNFSLLSNTGSRVSTGVWVTLGYPTGADQTGSNSYESTGTGSEYQTQYPVMDYTDPEHSIVLENASFDVTPSGIGQIIDFGDGLRIVMNIRLITDKLGTLNEPFLAKANGISDFMFFMKRAMVRDTLEFMPDVNARGPFNKVLLESTQDSRDGIEFKLKNMDTAEYYESGRLTFRKILV